MDDTTRTHELPPPAFTFHGQYSRSVDAKGRFNLPFRFRKGGPDTGEERYVVMQGPDGGLTVHPHAVWVEAYNRLRSGPPSPELRRNLRRMSLNSRMIEPDSQGRVAVPVDLLASVGIQKKILVVGVGSYMELWNPESLADEGDADPAALDAGFQNEFFR